MADAVARGDINADNGTRIGKEAVAWGDTPYAPNLPFDKYKGPGAERGVEGDCSGSVWKIYDSAGFRYEYTQSSEFDRLAHTPYSPFRRLWGNEAPQPGDVILYPGHMSIYAGDEM